MKIWYKHKGTLVIIRKNGIIKLTGKLMVL